MKAFFGRNRSSSVSERFVLVAMMPMRDWLPNSRLARSTEYAVDGSAGDFDSTPLTDSVAFSREVTALSAPIENAPMRPVNLPAPRIVVLAGAEA